MALYSQRPLWVPQLLLLSRYARSRDRAPAHARTSPGHHGASGSASSSSPDISAWVSPLHQELKLPGPPPDTSLLSSPCPVSLSAWPHCLRRRRHQNVGVILDASLLVHSPNPVLHPGGHRFCDSVSLVSHVALFLFHCVRLGSDSLFPTQFWHEP